MIDYIPLFKETLDRKHIQYCYHEGLLVFTQNYRNDRVDVQMRFAYLLFPAMMEIFVSIRHPLDSEQVASCRPLLEDANKDLQLGEFGADTPSNCVCFNHTFDPLAGEEWCTEARELAQEFIIEYTTEIVPPVLLGLFARAAVQAVATH